MQKNKLGVNNCIRDYLLFLSTRSLTDFIMNS